MEYKTLPELRNTYPVPENSLEDNSKYFTGNDTSVKYTGKYPENFITFNSVSISDLKLSELTTDGSINFKFIVQFFDGTEIDEWTSEPFKRNLELAKLENNPYFSKGRVTVAQIDYGKLKNYHTNFLESETYAQVVVDDTISTKEDIIKHINWMVDPVQDEIRTTTDFGSWTLNDPILINGIDVNAIQESEPESDSVESTIPPTIAVDYSPFGVPGNYIGDIRYRKSGLFGWGKRVPDYRWTGTNWVKL